MCKLTDAVVVADGQAVGTALENLGAAVQATDASLATSLTAAGQAIISATANWKTGDTLTDIETAEQAAIVVLNAIPLTSAWAPLVAIAFAALNLLIANSQTQSTQTDSVVGNAKRMLAKEETLNADSHWHGQAKLNHDPFIDVRKNFENTWNKAAKPLGVREVYV